MEQKPYKEIKHNLDLSNWNVEDSAFVIKGFQEVIFSVRNIEKSSSFYQKVGQWSEVYRGTVSKEQLTFWGLAKDCEAEECIIINPGDQEGFLRLVSFKNIAQEHIRSSPQSWDTGGIYDVDVRAVDLKSSFLEFQKEGWLAYNDPMEYKFTKFHISEVLVKGHEDIVFALIQRYQPKLEGYPNLKKLSHIFNSSQIVKDIEIAKDFYINKLGFNIYMEENLVGSDHEENLFGLPQNIYKQIERKLCIVNPQGNNMGSVELIQLKGISGKDFSSKARPPHLGIMALRFPIKNLINFIEHLKGVNIDIIAHNKIEVWPYGLCNSICIQSPDGAWLEFLEINENNSN